MNILILTWLFPPSTGGVETYTYNLAKSLSKKNNITVFTQGEKIKNYEKFEVIRIKEMYPYKKSKEELNNLSKKLKEILIFKKIDLVHSHNLICLPTKFSSTVIKTIRDLGIPIIDHCHDARNKNLNSIIIKKDIEKIIAVSEFAKNKIISFGGEKNKIKVIYNSISTNLFNPNNYSKIQAKKYFNLPLNKKIILFPSRAIRAKTGKFGPQKQFLTLLNSIKKIKKEFGNKFIVVFPIKVGSKENKAQLEKTLTNLESRLDREKIKENVLWISNKIEYSKMPLLYRTADIMCTPSLNEAFGLVFIEAMSMGIPSIGAKSGGITEIIKNKKTGFLINPRDSNELAKIITSLLKDDSLRNKIGLAGQKCVKQKFSYKNMLEELNKLYKSIPQKIYLIRHPETIKNKNGILTGWENSNYSKDGKKQFNKILDFFKGHQERIFSSDLPRCLNLAESISKKNDSLLIPTAFLREKNLKETRPYENFESNKEFIKRIKNFLRNYSLNGSIIISHSGVISNICKNAFKTEKELTNFPRDTIFLIETNKKEKKLIKIKL